LHTLITNSYGTYPSGTTFLLPDLRSRVPVGYNTDTISGRSTRAIALGSGTETHTLLDAEIPKHTHPVGDSGHDHDTTETAHSHTGTTADASTGITIADHNHKTFGSDGYVVHPWHNSPADLISNGSGIDGDRYGPFRTGTQLITGQGATPITDGGHPHSIGAGDLTPTATALTIDSETTGITVNEQGTGDTAHNIMQPYLVVNYIILAKHPTF
jgi:microcystin-dependent protein